MAHDHYHGGGQAEHRMLPLREEGFARMMTTHQNSLLLFLLLPRQEYSMN